MRSILLGTLWGGRLWVLNDSFSFLPFLSMPLTAVASALFPLQEGAAVFGWTARIAFVVRRGDGVFDLQREDVRDMCFQYVTSNCSPELRRQHRPYSPARHAAVERRHWPQHPDLRLDSRQEARLSVTARRVDLSRSHPWRSTGDVS